MMQSKDEFKRVGFISTGDTSNLTTIALNPG